MSDRELTEAAARAAGYKFYDDTDMLLDEQGDVASFDPLHDDGDAFRLAVKLDIRLRQRLAMVEAEYPWLDEEFNERKVLCEPILNDYYVSSRRAIVRAAAEIGKRVDTPQSAG